MYFRKLKPVTLSKSRSIKNIKPKLQTCLFLLSISNDNDYDYYEFK